MTTASANASYREISPKKLATMHKKPLVLDVRSGMEYKGGHVPGAVNLSLPRLMLGMMPLFRWMLPKWFRDLPKDQPIAVMCLTSHRSPIAARQLVNSGFQKVWNVSGGMMKWQQLGLDVEK
ncbi:rhodanese-like domain-containing protein [Geitlerinema sp. PCC 9228]|jgi:rhodanese-related sulfurtransferase|uniref:rhodanese-like domain-containing protein n=1 Tax=Geitlerinema sp. PCC 9228 TaxID=111611 RepID=UPI0008F9D698|nr:rhodanese-like domain-containing protein [Geitlerinema sp. PCC 9228]